MVHFDETIPPGGEGKISVKIDTSNYSQGAFKKTVRVYTNDPEKSEITLAVNASIKVPISISPTRVNLNGFEGDVISKSVTVTGNGNTPLELELKNFYFGEKVVYQIETIEEGKIYKIHFKNVPDITGTINAVLYLKTNYLEKPEISIPVKGKFQKKVENKDNNDKGTE